jgi:pyruvate dehydrogenase (quinone)/pyruvate oxidase
MGCGLPYAIAAQLAYPNRQVIAFIGDGAFSMLMAEMATAVKYELPIKVIVVKNNLLGHIRWEQMVFLGNPEYGCDLMPIDFAEIARACGAMGFSLNDPKECATTLRKALEAPGPVLVEASVDPNEPPVPASITVRQAAHFAEALAKGTREREKLLKDVMKYKIRELV